MPPMAPDTVVPSALMLPTTKTHDDGQHDCVLGHRLSALRTFPAGAASEIAHRVAPFHSLATGVGRGAARANPPAE